MFVLKLSILLVCAVCVPGRFISGGPLHYNKCVGSISLVTVHGDVYKFNESQEKVNIKATKAVLEGCGCYRLFERRKYKGRSYQVTRGGEQDIYIKKVRSVARTRC